VPHRPAPTLARCLAAGLLLAAAPPPLYETRPGEPVPVTISGTTIPVALTTANVDKLVLNAATIARLGIEPAVIKGKATVKIGPTKVLQGRNRPLDHTVAGAKSGDRILWFEGVDQPGADGSIGPWSIPHDRVAIRLPGAGSKPYSFPLLGDANSLSLTRVVTPDYGFGLEFGIESPSLYPVASAAAGAAIARALGGVATTQTWDEEVLLGITRPVRRVDLARSLVIGPFSFTTIAVRIRDAKDGMGSGAMLPQPPGPDDDPAEIVVTAVTEKGPRPIYTLSIPATALAACSRLEYAKKARAITLTC
jgi:hypothetical protein